MNAKRGYAPEDDKNFSPEAIRKMRTASRHVCYLINEGYDLKQATTFVGNHFLLSERQRLAMMRSLATDAQLAERKRKQVALSDLSGQVVWIDGFNMIITLEVMLSDSLLLECKDGTIRDLAALRGTYRLIPETEEAVRVMFDILQDSGVQYVKILLDEPVSNSGRLKSQMAEIAEEFSFEIDIQVRKDVDRALYEKERVITSDSIILDHCRSWVNLWEWDHYPRGRALLNHYPRGRDARGRDAFQGRLCRVWGPEEESDVQIRTLKPEETECLKAFLYEAIFIPEGVDPPPKDIILQPELKIYYEDFGSGRADHCLVAQEKGKIVGAVWTRIMNDYGHVDDETPSFAISLLPDARGRGIGTRLMLEMLDLLKSHGYERASLAVQKANYAVKMYEKLGFEKVDENSEEYIMVCRL